LRGGLTCASCAGRAEALVRRVWCRLLAQSDAEMTARMQRKNLQVPIFALHGLTYERVYSTDGTCIWWDR
jgi:hypothetical protein